MTWKLPLPDKYMQNAVFDGELYAVDMTYPPTPYGVSDDVALVGQVLSRNPYRPGWITMPVLEAEQAGARVTERIENAPHLTFRIPASYRAQEGGVVEMQFHFCDHQGRKRSDYRALGAKVPPIPEFEELKEKFHRGEQLTDKEIEYWQLYSHDPDWRGKKGGVHGGNKAVSDKVPEPQRSFLKYAVEEQHGFAHQLKWCRVLLATGYEWKGMVGRQLQSVFEQAEREELMDYDECFAFWQRHGKNKRWTLAKEWFEDAQPDETAGEPSPSADKPYIYGEDLEAARKDLEAARKDAESRGDMSQWVAITAEIDLRMTGKGTLPSFVTLDVVSGVEANYSTVRLAEVRKRLVE